MPDPGRRPGSAEVGASLVAALVGAGVTDAVLAPGSRSAPLAFALAGAERAGTLRLHVRLDERGAGFLALGLAKAGGRPVPVIVTSGTAVANLHPAVVEASHAGVPLLVISADRPGALRGTGAPQTIDQIKIFGSDVRAFAEVDPPPGEDAADYLVSVIARACGTATDPTDPGPVHLNVPFAEPLVRTAGAPASTRPPAHESRRPARISRPPSPTGESLAQVCAALGLHAIPERGLVIVGDLPGVGVAWPPAISALATAVGWPVIAEPTAGMHGSPAYLPTGPLLAAAIAAGRTGLRPEFVLAVGRIGLARPIAALIRAADRHVVVDPTRRWADPTRTASAVLLGALPRAPQDAPPSTSAPWSTSWRDADAAVDAARTEVLAGAHGFSGLHVAEMLWATLPGDALVHLGASWPIRQAMLTARRRTGLRVHANRGTNGIDGVVSTARGAAIAHHLATGGATTSLLGDLTFLHDATGLLAGADEAVPPLTYVVIDNHGGGIFSQLEQGAPAYRTDFERIFGTPQAADIVAVSRAMGVPATGIDSADGLRAALAGADDGVRVLVARVQSRSAEAGLLRSLAEAASGALR